MPNHVINEVIFRDVDAETQEAILAVALNNGREIDFEVLLPPPLNIWMGGVREVHEKRFPGTGLDWSTKNWGTKWNAYGQKQEGTAYLEQSPTILILRFQTAWNPPMGWLVAIFNSLKISFEHNWLSEGSGRGKSAVWDYAAMESQMSGSAWEEKDCSEEMQKYLHKLLWGVEEFTDEDED